VPLAAKPGGLLLFTDPTTLMPQTLTEIGRPVLVRGTLIADPASAMGPSVPRQSGNAGGLAPLAGFPADS
jgi:hypothetical protein